jgi:hypothetical protein
MAKTTISNTDLTWIFYEKLKAFDECPSGLPIAITHDSKFGWRAITNPKHFDRHLLCTRRIQTIQKQLREIYVLEKD